MSYYYLLLIIMLFAITPGPGIAFVLAQGISQNLPTVFTTVLGLTTGDMLYLLIAIFGLGFLNTLINDIEFWTALFGGIYMLAIAIKIFIHRQDKLQQKSSNNYQSFITGLLISCSNPKVIIFYITILPSIIELNNLRFTDVMLLELVVFVGIFIPVICLGYFANKAKLIFNKKYLYLNIFTCFLMLSVSMLLFNRILF